MRTFPTQLAQCVVAFVWTVAVCVAESAVERYGRTPTNWTDPGPANGTTYSVIVEAINPRPSSQFGDKERVQFFSRLDRGGRVVSAQFVAHLSEEADRSLAVLGHPDHADKRVRMVFVSDMALQFYPDKVSHLRNVCADDRETTIMVIVDETCDSTVPPQWLPTVCLSNLIRVYPFNDGSLGTMRREAYMPLGPRSTFPFISRERVQAATTRSLFLSLQVHVDTSPRRLAVAYLVEEFSKVNPEVPLSYRPGNFNVREWQTLLLDSTFTICPGGHNPETFRLWEALEAGSIPIISKLDFTHPAYTFNNHSCGVGDVAWNTVASSPFAKETYVNSWKELPERLQELQRKSDEYINKLQEDCMAWYADRMAHTYTSLLRFGEGNDMLPQTGPIIDTSKDDSPDILRGGLSSVEN